jgi:hypothetical protein
MLPVDYNDGVGVGLPSSRMTLLICVLLGGGSACSWTSNQMTTSHSTQTLSAEGQ